MVVLSLVSLIKFLIILISLTNDIIVFVMLIWSSFCLMGCYPFCCDYFGQLLIKRSVTISKLNVASCAMVYSIFMTSCLVLIGK